MEWVARAQAMYHARAGGAVASLGIEGRQVPGVEVGVGGGELSMTLGGRECSARNKVWNGICQMRAAWVITWEQLAKTTVCSPAGSAGGRPS